MQKKTFPDFVPPMMAQSAKEAFDSPDWIFEIKLDGYRAITVFDAVDKPRLWSRTHSSDAVFRIRRALGAEESAKNTNSPTPGEALRSDLHEGLPKRPARANIIDQKIDGAELLADAPESRRYLVGLADIR
jgi:hypothetical protein